MNVCVQEWMCDCEKKEVWKLFIHFLSISFHSDIILLSITSLSTNTNSHKIKIWMLIVWLNLKKCTISSYKYEYKFPWFLFSFTSMTFSSIYLFVLSVFPLLCTLIKSFDPDVVCCFMHIFLFKFNSLFIYFIQHVLHNVMILTVVWFELVLSFCAPPLLLKSDLWKFLSLSFSRTKSKREISVQYSFMATYGNIENYSIQKGTHILNKMLVIWTPPEEKRNRYSFVLKKRRIKELLRRIFFYSTWDYESP